MMKDWIDPSIEDARAHSKLRLSKALAFTGGDIRAELAAKQKGLCAICGATPEKRRLALDHCHRTAKVRGLLCVRCNTGIGMFWDDPHLLGKAIEYLSK